MNYADFTGLSQEVLHGKETAVLLGMSWTSLGEGDRMVRLFLVPVDGGVTMQVFMHRLTPIPFQGHHESPEDLPINDAGFRVIHQGVIYQVANRLTASWRYFSETHAF